MKLKRKSLPIERLTRSIGRRHRGGYVLVLVALMLFGLMAMAALVIDIGFARLAQRQMQTAVDSAAIEGLRYRDDPSEPDATIRETARRERASQMVAMIFDDDLLSTPEDAFQFGAGPIVEFTDGAGDSELNASKFINSPGNPNPNPKIGSLPSVPVYKPTLQTNTSNAGEGDMVAGDSFDAAAVHSEDASYNRADFVRNGTANDVFLVRMRRTNEIETVGVRTSGPTLPYLFARGSLMFDQNTPSNPRRLIGEGIKVRATSIAAAKPVVCIGTTAGPSGLKSLAVAYEKSNWLLNDLSNAFVFDGVTIGDAVTTTNAAGPNQPGFVGIFDVNLRRVIAFGFVRLGTNGVVEKFQSGSNSVMSIAHENASPAFLFDLLARGTDTSLSQQDRSIVIGLVLTSRSAFLNELLGANTISKEILHAPALVR